MRSLHQSVLDLQAVIFARGSKNQQNWSRHRKMLMVLLMIDIYNMQRETNQKYGLGLGESKLET